MAHSTEDIRNIALVGHSGAGKTLLADALLAASGAIPARGAIDKGTTVCDFTSAEKQLGHSIDTALCHFTTQGKHVNVIDTPGFPDFLGRALTAIEAVATACVVVSAANGVEPVTQRAMDYAKNRKLCRMVIINKIDHPKADLEGTLQQVRDIFGKECLPINLPAEGGQAVVDCYFQPHGKPTDFSTVEQAHSEIIDQVVEVDDALMALYLEQGEELSPEQLHDPFEKALREGHLIPVCFCSAETGAGIPELLDIIARLVPNPTEGNPPPFLKGDGPDAELVKIVPKTSEHVIAHVFKVAFDSFVGKLGVFRVHQGTVKTGMQLYVGDARKPIKIARLYQLQGKDRIEMTEAVPGDICGVVKIDDIHFDAVLHDSHDEDKFHLKGVNFPPPMLGVAIEPERRGDEQKISEGLHRLTEEDPCVSVQHIASSNETVLYGLGDLHLRVMLDALVERHGVKLKTHPPSIPYRETITAKAEGHHRHKKQTGGAGQFGEVYLRVEPLDRGGGFEFVDEIKGGTIPSHFIPAVEKGVRQVLVDGAIAGYRLQDVRVVVYDGKHHSVDSKEVAFISAGKRAFLDAIKKAHPIVLEPIVRVEITAPNGAIGDVTGDISSRRGRINGSNTLPGGRAQITALVPLAELTEYASHLKGLTGGMGTFTMDLSHYDPVQQKTQEELMQAFKPMDTGD
ncbi:MAG: elongation factor G [Polyangiaceae bacterium]